MFFVFDSFLINIKLKKYVIVACLNPFLIVYCPDKYETQRMCDEVVDNSLAALKLIHDWFVASEMIKNLYTALYADDGLLFFNKDSGDVTFCCNEMVILSVNLNKINLDNNFDEDDPDTIILIRLLAWHSKFKKRKTLKKELNE